MLKGKKAQAMFTKHARHSETSVICSTQVLTDGNTAGNAALKNLLRNTDILTIHESPFISDECARITRAMFPEILIDTIYMTVSKRRTRRVQREFLNRFY